MRFNITDFGSVGILLAIGCSTSSGTTGANSDGSVNNTVVFLDAGDSAPDSPDGGPQCPLNGCNYQTQLGCGSGQMCHPALTGSSVAPQCVTAETKAAGESCKWQECQPGLFCAGDRHCRHLCCAGDWSVCASNETCTEAILLQSDPDAGIALSANVNVCQLEDPCDVLNPNSCPVGKSCYIVDSRGGVRCLPTGTVPLQGGCTSTQLCVAGFTCVQGPKGGSNCRRLCRAVAGGADPYCPTSEGYCSHFVRDPPEVGECTPAR